MSLFGMPDKIARRSCKGVDIVWHEHNEISLPLIIKNTLWKKAQE